jgi:uncharacterized membrane protein
VGARPRLDVIDWLRGLVIVLMALDHTRDFAGDMSVDAMDLAKTNVPLFFTRWVTHLCAPTFVFLAGVGALLMRGRGRTTGQLSLFLLTRGVWMVVLEVTWIKFWWSPYKVDYGTVGLAVFGALGAGMVALSALVWLPRWLVGVIGLTIVCGHNAFDWVDKEDLGRWQGVWALLHAGGPVPIADGFQLWAAYPWLPWIGVMACGYAAGGVFTLDRPTRRQTLATLGLGCLAAFLVLRGGNVYGNPKPWEAQSSPGWNALAILNCQKYPPSLAYLLVTLGVVFLLAAAADREQGPPGKWVVTFGRVPLFFYLTHLPLIQAFAAAVFVAGQATGWGRSIEEAIRIGQGVPLPGVYLIWATVVFILYWPCRWFAAVKQRNKSVWLSYL